MKVWECFQFGSVMSCRGKRSHPPDESHGKPPRLPKFWWSLHEMIDSWRDGVSQLLITGRGIEGSHGLRTPRRAIVASSLSIGTTVYRSPGLSGRGAESAMKY
jgi:hypothetical protein